MGACLSNATKVSGSSSSNAAVAANNPGEQQPHHQRHRKTPGAQRKLPPQQRDQNQHHQRDKEQLKRPTGVVPCGKRTNFGYDRDFESRYAIGKLLGHGQFGYTFVATNKVNGDRVAVKRIDKNKVNGLSVSPYYARNR